LVYVINEQGSPFNIFFYFLFSQSFILVFHFIDSNFK